MRTKQKFPTDYTPASDVLIAKFGLITAAVYGKVWRYCQSADGVCRASLTRLGIELGVSHDTVQRSIKALEAAGYIVDKTPTLRNRPHLYYCTDKLSSDAVSVSEVSGNAQSVSSDAVSVSQTRTVRDEDSIEDSKEESVEHTPNPKDQRQRPAIEKTKSSNLAEHEVTTQDRLATVDVRKRLEQLTGNYFWMNDETVRVGLFILEREAEGQSLEKFMSSVADERKKKYSRFPADIVKEWGPVFQEQRPAGATAWELD